jgi:hypothetical protein
LVFVIYRVAIPDSVMRMLLSVSLPPYELELTKQSIRLFILIVYLDIRVSAIWR